ncbi:TPA: hypothetical protein ACOFBV_004590 [Stenotrophomonas maltophilia]
MTTDNKTLPVFRFARYVNGVRMAEGVTIEKANNLPDAMRTAAKLATIGHGGDVPVLVHEPATLADVQPGGRVRLGDQAELDRLEFQAWARELLPCPFCGNSAEFVPYKDNGLTLKCKSMGCIQRNQRTLRYGIDWLRTSMAEHWNTRALSAQPSPGGQRDDSPMAKMAAALRGKAEAERAAFDQRVQSGEWGPMPDNPDVLELPPLPEGVDSVRCMIRGEKGFAEPCDYYFTSKQMRDYARTALAARQPVGEVEPHGWILTGPEGSMFCPAAARSVMEAYIGSKYMNIETVYAAPPAQQPAQGVDLGLQLDRYDAGLLGDGGGGDVGWWQDYIRAELDRAHEFYQDQADAHG